MSRVDKIRLKLKFDSAIGNGEDNSKIWLFWQSTMNLVIVQQHPQFITMGLQNGSNIDCYFSFVYASCEASARRELFDALISFGGNLDTAWVMGGDVNAILSPTKKIGRTLGYIDSMINFSGFMAAAGLLDAGFSGSAFTWTNK